VKYFAIAVVISLFGLMQTTPTLAESALIAQAQDVADRLEGVMETSKQAIANPKVPNVRMTTCRIQLAQAALGTIGLYQEQALSGQLDKPYRQRFLLIEPSPYSQSVRSLSFKPSNLTTWINFCDRPISKRVLQPNKLGTPICQIFCGDRVKITLATRLWMVALQTCVML
jgi:hypothetical protein